MRTPRVSPSLSTLPVARRVHFTPSESEERRKSDERKPEANNRRRRGTIFSHPVTISENAKRAMSEVVLTTIILIPCLAIGALLVWNVGAIAEGALMVVSGVAAAGSRRFHDACGIIILVGVSTTIWFFVAIKMDQVEVIPTICFVSLYALWGRARESRLACFLGCVVSAVVSTTRDHSSLTKNVLYSVSGILITLFEFLSSSSISPATPRDVAVSHGTITTTTPDWIPPLEIPQEDPTVASSFDVEFDRSLHRTLAALLLATEGEEARSSMRRAIQSKNLDDDHSTYENDNHSMTTVHLKEIVGSGSFGEIYRATMKRSSASTTSNEKVEDHERGEECVAVKRVSKRAGISDHSIMRSLVREIGALCLIKPHPNVVKIIGWRRQPYACLITEFASCGSLRSFLLRGEIHGGRDREEGLFKPRALSSVKAKMAVEAAMGVAHLHSLGFSHGDVKSENFLVFEREVRGGWGRWVVKLSDFGNCERVGSCRQHDDDDDEMEMEVGLEGERETRREKKTVGSLLWLAPECARGAENDGVSLSRDARRADVWSFGMCLLELYTHELPYYRRHFNVRDVGSGALAPMTVELASEIRASSPALLGAIENCLRYDERARWEMKKVLFSLLIGLVRVDGEDDFSPATTIPEGIEVGITSSGRHDMSVMSASPIYDGADDEEEEGDGRENGENDETRISDPTTSAMKRRRKRGGDYSSTRSARWRAELAGRGDEFVSFVEAEDIV